MLSSWLSRSGHRHQHDRPHRADRLQRRLLLAAYLGAGVIAGSVSFALGQSKNLEVFRHASRALLASRDLYDGSSVDWFKYSPTFALLFLPFAWMPAWIAAAAWGAFNFGVAFLGIEAISLSRDRSERDARRGAVAAAPNIKAHVVLLAALPGILLATDGDQANLLVVGAMLYAFASFEKSRTLVGAAAVALGALVKIFPIAAVLFALGHRDRERSLFRVIALLGLGAVLPLLVVRPSVLAQEYASWLMLLRADHANHGWSIVTVARSLGLPASSVQIAAGATLLIPLIGSLMTSTSTSSSSSSHLRFRRAFAASLLLLIVLCNHRSEYTSFVISSIGVALWFADAHARAADSHANGDRIDAARQKTHARARLALLLLASIAHGPILVLDDPVLGGPLSFLAAHRVFHPLRLVPITIVWGLLQIDMLRVLARSPWWSLTLPRSASLRALLSPRRDGDDDNAAASSTTRAEDETSTRPSMNPS